MTVLRKVFFSFFLFLLVFTLSGCDFFKPEINPDYTTEIGGACEEYLNAAKIINWVAGRKYCLSADVTHVAGVIFDIDANNVELDCQGFTIRGDGGFNCVETTNSHNSNVTGCYIVNCSYGVLATAANNNLVFNNTFEVLSGDYGVRGNGNNMKVLNNTFFGAGIATYNFGWVTGSVIANNTVSTVGGFMLSARTSYNISITDNIIKDGGYVLDVASYNMSNVTFARNYINNITTGYKTGLYIRNRVENLFVYDNVIDNTERFAYCIRPTWCDNFVFDNNSYYNNNKISSSGVYVMQNASNIIFTNNKFYNNSNYFFAVFDNVSSSLVENNWFGTPESRVNLTSSVSYDVFDLNGLKDVNIRYNRIYCDTCSGIFAQSYNGYLINVNISNNSYDAINQKGGHIFGIGTEYTTIFDGSGGIIEYNNITIQNYIRTGADGTHGIYLGHNNNSIMRGNIVNGSTHGLLVKGCYNATVYDNFAYNSEFNSLYDKGGLNNTFYNNYLYQPNNASFLYVVKASEEPGFRNTTGMRVYDTILDYTTGVNDAMKIDARQNITVINCSYQLADEEVLGNLTRGVWYNGWVTLEAGNSDAANVTMYLGNNKFYDKKPSSNGITERGNVIYYYNIAGVRTYVNQANVTINSTYKDVVMTYSRNMSDVINQDNYVFPFHFYENKSCNAPIPPINWYINMTDYCYFYFPIYNKGFNTYLFNPGIITFNTTAYLGNLFNFTDNKIIYVKPAATLLIG